MNNPARGVSRKVTFVFVLVIAALTLNAYYLFSSVATSRDANTVVRRVFLATLRTEQIVKAVNAAESTQRSFLIDPVNMEYRKFFSYKADFELSISNALALFSFDQGIHDSAKLMISQGVERMAALEEILQLAQTDRQEALRIWNQGEGRVLMENFMRTAVGLEKSFEEMLNTSIDVADRGRSLASTAYYVTFGSTFLLAFFVYVLSRRQFSAQVMENWRQGKIRDLNSLVLGSTQLNEQAQIALNYICTILEGQVGTIYLKVNKDLELSAALGLERNELPQRIRMNERIVGSAAVRGQIELINDVKDDFLKVSTSLGYEKPKNIVIVPLMHEDNSVGVIEIGTQKQFSEIGLKFLQDLQTALGDIFSSAISRAALNRLLIQTQEQAEELQAQQEELKAANEELEEQAEALKASEIRLQEQKEELKQSNEELESQTQALAEQSARLQTKNLDLEAARADLEESKRQLETASRYKSQFLANMSHELRTPLNSLLILSATLSENKSGNLTEKQVEYVSTINSAGNDLLNLINDILDLAKVEAGRFEIIKEDMLLPHMLDYLSQQFSPLAKKKGLGFETSIGDEVPSVLHTDRQRLEQVLKNLLSNAVKFTLSGKVKLSVNFHKSNKNEIAFEVVDTGIGISPEKKGVIFEAFTQAEGGISRQFGGTGLGLTISRELTRLLGGRIEVESVEGEGSTFRLILPTKSALSTESPALQSRSVDDGIGNVTAKPKIRPEDIAEDDRRHVSDDRETLKEGDKCILVVEDDLVFAEVLMNVCRESGFKVLHTSLGENALILVERFPVSAILLDLKLPGASGMGILDALKNSPKTRHIPVHMMSGVDYSLNARKLGAAGYITKPASPTALKGALKKISDLLSFAIRKILIVEDEEIQRNEIKRLLESTGVETRSVGTAADALQALSEEHFDSMVLDLRLPDMSGLELLEVLSRKMENEMIPVIIYTGKDLSPDEEMMLRRYADKIIIKSARSPERLIDEATLFLHRLESEYPSDTRQLLEKVRADQAFFNQKHVLIVDDDLRNVYALLNVLESKGLKVSVARDGIEALEVLKKDKTIELVLMDIMMPRMDGFEAIKRIREDLKLKKLPVVAVTAKAMKGDQEKCFDVGANDYLPKPIQLDRLFSVLRVWLSG